MKDVTISPTLIQRMKSIGLFHWMKPKAVGLPPTKLLQNIDVVPLETFINCIVDNDYTGLLVQGHATDEQLHTAFTELYDQYIEAIGGKELVRHIADVKRIAIIQAKVQRAEALIEIIQQYPTRGLFEQLFTFGYPLPKEEYSYFGINKVLRIFVAKYKRDKTEADRLIFEYESSQGGKRGTEKGYSREYFYDSIVEMSTAFKFQIQLKDLTVSMYCTYMRKYKAYIDHMNKQQQA